jgi:hypothetical protein
MAAIALAETKKLLGKLVKLAFSNEKLQFWRQNQAGKKWPQVVNHDQWRLIVVSLLSRALTAKLGATFPQLLCNIWHKKRDRGRINFPSLLLIIFGLTVI